MENTEIIEFKKQLSFVSPPISTACSLPPRAYSDSDILALETAHIFRKSWLGFGRVDQWKDAGDYSCHDILGIPFIVIRDNKGNLNAYANSCRHRGARLLDGKGSCQVIRCPFHRWTYALDGRLLTAPKIKQSDNFDYKEYGLIPIQIQQRDGFAFISFNPQPVPIDEWLGDFSQLHTPWDFSSLITYKRHEFTVQCNWKAFLEVFNEYYHLPYVHPDSINSVYLNPNPSDDVSGQFASQFGATDGTGALLESTQQYALPTMASLDPVNTKGARYSWLFPNMAFAAGAESVWIYEAYPLASDSSQIVLTLCFPDATAETAEFEQRADFYFDRLIAAIEEDIPALENQQLGLNSALAVQGRFCEELEPNVAKFAFWYAKQFDGMVS